MTARATVPNSITALLDFLEAIDWLNKREPTSRKVTIGTRAALMSNKLGAAIISNMKPTTVIEYTAYPRFLIV